MKTRWCRGWRLAGHMGTLLLVWLTELQGTIALRVGQDGHSAGLWLAEQSPLRAGSHQAVSPEHRGFAGTLCLPVGRFSHLTCCHCSWARAASWPSISEQVLSEFGAGWLQPCIYGLYFLYISFPLASVFFLHIPKLYQGASELMGSPEVQLEIVKITTQSTILARVQQIGSVSNQFSLY